MIFVDSNAHKLHVSTYCKPHKVISKTTLMYEFLYLGVSYLMGVSNDDIVEGKHVIFI